METRTVELGPKEAELVTRILTQELREENLSQPEVAAAREIRSDIATAESVQVLGKI